MPEQDAGDPGRTPGSAEGDRETVEQDLNEKGLDGEAQGGEKEKSARQQTSSQ